MNNQLDIRTYDDMNIAETIQILDQGLRREYLNSLDDLSIIPIDEMQSLENEIIDNIRLYKITEMVYEKGELATDKFNTVFNTLSTYNASVFVVLDSNGLKTDYYVGVRNNEFKDEEKKSTVTLGDTLKNALVGHFPGIRIENADRLKIKAISENILSMQNVASVSVSGSHKSENNKTNGEFVQGLEKLALAMEGRQYTGIIVAQNQSKDAVNKMRNDYQELYTKLSPYKKVQISTSESTSISRQKSFAEMDNGQRFALLVGSGTSFAASVGGAIIAEAVGAMIGGQIAGQLNQFITSLAPNEQISKSSTASVSNEIENKAVMDLLQYIENALNQIDEFYSYGMWNVAGYFASDDMSTAEIAASNYRSLMSGEKSGKEISLVNSWRSNTDDYKYLTRYISRFYHPKFQYNSFIIDPSTCISGNKLGLHLGLPRASTPGLPVIEHAQFGKEVNTYNVFGKEEDLKPENRITLGKVFDLGKITEKKVELDNGSLNMHSFITGSTGSGKSNAVYQILTELYQDKVPFLVIEPAKGEYKDVFGHWDDVNVYSTNPSVAPLININPFKFPESIHVLEHVDGLVEIFSVCWPMYDAMPAFFKDAILRSYEVVGWDLGSSTFEGNEVEYPDFEIVVEQLNQLIEQSDYASDIKSNYRGALITRVKSLTVGLNKFIFTSEQTPYSKMFDENCIVDISRVKSTETKALIMGVLVYMLNEYRVDKKSENNSGLKHVTVLEEAHNLLKNTSNNDSDLVGKSVEMLTQTIAEIRTYGEGFIIVDQSPSSVDIAAIKNTNTKIVLRTPEGNDREIAGRSMGLTDDQINEIAKLPSGVAVVYQNNWLNPVLTLIDKAEVVEQPFLNQHPVEIKPVRKARTEIIKAIMEPWLPGDVIDFAELSSALNTLEISRANKKLLSVMIYTYRNHNGHILWKENSMDLLKAVLYDILSITEAVISEVIQSNNPNRLRNLVATKTVGLSDEEIEEICHVLTMEDAE